MGFYLEILAVQRPFDVGSDDNNRNMVSVNFDALAAAPVDKWEEEIASVLATAGLSTLWNGSSGDTFIGRNADIPGDLVGPLVQIIDTGGGPPELTRNLDAYEQLSAQVLVRAKSYVAARTRALAIWRTLHGIFNTTVTAP